jgi:5-(carboxyamino)imidazole ribonucleotide synthase
MGLLAVEMFQTDDDEILINEVATIPLFHRGKLYFQFENHLRAILDLPLEIQTVK